MADISCNSDFNFNHYNLMYSSGENTINLPNQAQLTIPVSNTLQPNGKKQGRGAIFGMVTAISAATSLAIGRLCISVVSNAIPVGQLIFIRSSVMVIGTAITLGILRESPLVKPPSCYWLIGRALLGNTSSGFMATAVYIMPVGEATALLSTAPIWTTAISYFWLKERYQKRVMILGLCGMLGVFLAAWPTQDEQTSRHEHLLGATCALIAAVLAATSYCIVRHIGLAVHFMVMVFFFGSGGLLLSSISLAFWPFDPKVWINLPTHKILAILGYSVADLIAQSLLHLTLQHSGASIAAYFRHADIFICFIFQLAVFQEIPKPITIVGATIIFVCTVGIGVTHVRNSRANKKMAVDESPAAETDQNLSP